MEFNSNNYEIIQSTQCDCNYKFTLNDIDKIQKVKEHGFYGNNIKHISNIKCPNCKKYRALLLKQKGQTWQIVAVGFLKDILENTESDNSDIDKKKNTSNEFICKVCGKVCKSQLGLNAHLKIHQN